MNLNITSIRKHLSAIRYRIDAGQFVQVLAHLDEIEHDLLFAACSNRRAISSLETILGLLYHFKDSFKVAPAGRKTCEAYLDLTDAVKDAFPMTYGCLTAGSVFSVPGYLAVLRKTKRGVETAEGALYDHLPSNQVVF